MSEAASFWSNKRTLVSWSVVMFPDLQYNKYITGAPKSIELIEMFYSRGEIHS